jgi:phenylpropionate dioxygenase-like ring-hydroxylating dioxygenase large terminal subunit
MGVSFARHGIVDGEGIRCRFHGWTWDADGRRVHMSWHGRAMAMFELHSFAVREVGGAVWIRLAPES